MISTLCVMTQVIENPMDLSTMLVKAKKGGYEAS